MNPIDAFKDYLSIEKNYSIHTIEAYLHDIKDFESFLLREELAADLMDANRERLGRNYIAHLDYHRFSKKTIARKLSALRTFYDYARTQGWVDKNIFETLQSPKIPKKLPTVMHTEEIDLIFKSIDTSKPLGYRNYLIFDLLFSSGLRASELCQMTIRDIKLDQEVVLIHGKGAKDRYLPLHQGLITQLRHYLTYIRPILLSKGKDSTITYVFINHLGSGLTVRGLQHILKSTIEKSGETYKIHPHMLRHAFATVLLDHGADLRVVQELLGHAHLKSTQIYTHVSTKSMREKYEKTHPRMVKKHDENR